MKGQKEQIIKQVVTRFAPSPTGFLHLGNYRTAVFSYLYARQRNGKFIVRIEDTDKERSKKEFELNIIESLAWLGLDFDELFKQSDRIDSHRKYLNQLIKDGKAYVSKEAAKDGSGVIKEIIRFKNPNKLVAFHDLIRGRIEIDTTDLGDFVIAKNINEPLFHLAVVVDDFEMGVSHVVRGEDHISNTPRHILIQEAIGAPTPTYAHLPLVLADDRSKLSKRKGALPLTDYRDLGYIADALLNTMALIGWNPGTEQEIFSLNELIKIFDLSKVQKGGAIFNPIKLDWINKEHIKRLPEAEQISQIKSWLAGIGFHPADKMLENLRPIIIDRISKWADIKTMHEAGELEYFFKTPEYSKDGLIWKKLKDNPEKFILSKKYLEKVYELLHDIPVAGFNHESVKLGLSSYAEQEGKGEVLWPLRYALSGAEKSPDPFTLAPTLGKVESLNRIKAAIDKLSS
jgi:glutamyl-tRNA synthetase